MAGVEVTPCTPRFWRQVAGGPRPPVQWLRQVAILRRLWQEAPEDFLLHVDADEFLHYPGDLAARLAALPREIDALLVPVAERAYLEGPDPATVFGGLFCRPAPPALSAPVAAIHGEAARFLDSGVTGYPSGKSFFRTRGRLRPDIHAPEGDWTGALEHAPEGAILHFEGLTPIHWVDKRRRKLAQEPDWQNNPMPGRRAQFQALAGLDAAGALALHDRLKVLSLAQVAALDALGLILRLPFDPRPAIARRWPGPAPDVSLAAFDRQPLRMPPGPGPMTRLRRLAGRALRAFRR
jgi:hypothetical protein